MAAVFPTIYPTGYKGDATDFQRTKVDRSGAMRMVQGTVTPAISTAATIIGLMPFNKGFSLGYGSSVFIPQLDSTNAGTVSMGYYYSDSAGLVAASSSNAFVSASTLVSASGGGAITPNLSAGETFNAAGDGWIALWTSAATTTAAAINFNLAGSYDDGGVGTPAYTT